MTDRQKDGQTNQLKPERETGRDRERQRQRNRDRQTDRRRNRFVSTSVKPTLNQISMSASKTE